MVIRVRKSLRTLYGLELSLSNHGGIECVATLSLYVARNLINFPSEEKKYTISMDKFYTTIRVIIIRLLEQQTLKSKLNIGENRLTSL